MYFLLPLRRFSLYSQISIMRVYDAHKCRNSFNCDKINSHFVTKWFLGYLFFEIVRLKCSPIAKLNDSVVRSWHTSTFRKVINVRLTFVCRRAVLRNPDLLPESPWNRLLENDFWGTPLGERGSHGSYRPLCVATFRLNHLLGGFDPRGYHLVNVALHAACTGLVVRIAKKVRLTSFKATLTLLILNSSQVHTECVFVESEFCRGKCMLEYIHERVVSLERICQEEHFYRLIGNKSFFKIP